MSRKICLIVTLSALGSAVLGWGAVALPVKDALIQETTAAAGLRTEVQGLAEQQRGPLWIGYEVPLVSEIGGFCCAPGSACVLEKESERMFQSEQRARAPHPGLMVLLRVYQGRVAQIRSFTTDCSLDASGLPLVWLRNVEPEDSVALLSSFVRPQASDAMAHAAIWAIGAHAGKAADEALKGFVRTAGTPWVRQEVLTRLGNVRGRAGFEILRDLLEGEENAAMRQEELFGIVMSHEPEAKDVILQFAREDRDLAVRCFALLHYAQEAGRQALPVLSEVIAHDPSREVRSAAVAALKHLPDEDKEEARAVLEDLAKRNADPELRLWALSVLDRMDECERGLPAPNCSPR